jgi:AcrR family transcriptional regulator
MLICIHDLDTCTRMIDMALNSKNTEKIVSAAIELLKGNDYSSVQVKDICKKAHVPRSSFYSVFSGKDDILMHVLRGYKDDFEGTMRALLNANSSLEKLWVLYDKYLALADYFGLHLISAMFTLELEGKLRFTSGIDEYLAKYIEWFVRFVRDCQSEGVIRNSGLAEDLVPVGKKLAFFVVYEWCVCGGEFELRDRAFAVIEDFYDVVPQCRGLRP